MASRFEIPKGLPSRIDKPRKFNAGRAALGKPKETVWVQINDDCSS